MDWYAVKTQARREQVAVMSLQRLGVGIFSPKLKGSRAINPLFPGYCFVRFDAATHYRAVHYAHGVRGVVAFGSIPAKIDEEIILSIQSRVKDGYIVVESTGFASGQIVKIHQGPFEGLEAIFEREQTAQKRVVLLLKMLKYQAYVVVGCGQIKAASN